MKKLKIRDVVRKEYHDENDTIICPICSFQNKTDYDIRKWMCENCNSEFQDFEVMEILKIGKIKHKTNIIKISNE